MALAPCFQEFISQNPALKGENTIYLPYIVPHKRESICPLVATRPSEEKTVPATFPVRTSADHGTSRAFPLPSLVHERSESPVLIAGANQFAYAGRHPRKI
jgi:hypothetical protein